MSEWKMLTLVGEDRPGIVSQITQSLFELGCALGEASMIRLGGNFSIMMMVSGDGDIEPRLRPVADELGLRLHLDPMVGGLHQHRFPNFQVRVSGADRPGIVAQVTGALADAGFNILELESDVAGTRDKPVYIMQIQGYSAATLEDLESAVSALAEQGVGVTIAPIETLIG